MIRNASLLRPQVTPSQLTGSFEAVVGHIGTRNLNGQGFAADWMNRPYMVALSSWNHNWCTSGPAGTAIITVEGSQIIARGRFDQFTRQGRAGLYLVKRFGQRCRWSLTWHVACEEVRADGTRVTVAGRPLEVSPGEVAADMDTRTLKV